MRRLATVLNPARWTQRHASDEWVDTWPGILRKTAIRWATPGHWLARRRVRSGLRIPPLPVLPGSVWAIAMVKNEVDLIEPVLRHLAGQDLDQILVLDNGSTDGTRELLAELARELPLAVGDDGEPGYFQAHKMTALAGVARRHGADWVVPFDADELWFARDESIGSLLRRSSATRVEAPMHNAFPTPENPRLSLAGPVRLDASPHFRVKVAARTHPLLWIGMGNHTALRPGRKVDGLYVLHLPWRTPEQFRQKIRQGAAAYRQARIPGVGGHWLTQDAKSDAELAAVWRALVYGQAADDLEWAPVGPFVSCHPGSWQSWDPERIIPAGIRRQRVPARSTEGRQA